jgi:hypothetical protein
MQTGVLQILKVYKANLIWYRKSLKLLGLPSAAEEEFPLVRYAEGLRRI